MTTSNNHSELVCPVPNLQEKETMTADKKHGFFKNKVLNIQSIILFIIFVCLLVQTHYIPFIFGFLFFASLGMMSGYNRSPNWSQNNKSSLFSAVSYILSLGILLTVYLVDKSISNTDVKYLLLALSSIVGFPFGFSFFKSIYKLKNSKNSSVDIVSNENIEKFIETTPIVETSITPINDPDSPLNDDIQTKFSRIKNIKKDI